MNKNDVVVVGGGLAGLMAAAVAVKRGKKVLLLTKGVGAIAIGGGSIDVLGYGADGRPLKSPAAGLYQLSPAHPYARIGHQGVTAALAAFLELTAAEGYPYVGSITQNQWLPTAVGTLKPSCLVPKTMEPKGLKAASQVTVVGFTGLKDYYPELVVDGLRQQPGFDKTYNISMLESGLAQGRDLTALDIARWLDKEAGRKLCIEQLGRVLTPGAVVLVPPVLGTSPDYLVADELSQATGCSFIEITGPPPAVTGLRLRTMLIRYLKKQGVDIVEQANVSGAIVEGGRCQAVITSNVDRKRSYYADAFILATGGFFGGGLEAMPGKARELIFDLPVTVSTEQAEWSNPKLFAAGGQPFARLGVAVDEALRPIGGAGEALLANVHIAGQTLAGYDYAWEKSGNGVAIASGYQAAMSI